MALIHLFPPQFHLSSFFVVVFFVTDTLLRRCLLGFVVNALSLLMTPPGRTAAGFISRWKMSTSNVTFKEISKVG